MFKLFGLVAVALVFSAECITASKPFRFLGKRTPAKPHGKLFDATNYYASAAPTTWTTAASECALIFGGNATLLSVETEEEYNWLNEYLIGRGIQVGLYWTGGLYDLTNGVWRWSGNPDAHFDDFTQWGVGQPTSTNSRQRVATNFIKGGTPLQSTWLNIDDSALSKYICEVPVVEEVPVDGEAAICYDPHSIVLAIDSSSSVGANEFTMAKQFASELSAAFTLEAIGKKFGFITYSLLPSSEIHLSESIHSFRIDEIMMGVNHQNYSLRNTQDAMRNAKVQLEELSGGLPMEMIVLTNGISAYPSVTKKVATEANLAGIRTYAVGLSYANPGNELLNIAGGNADRVFQADWNNLKDLLKPMSEYICSESKI